MRHVFFSVFSLVFTPHAIAQPLVRLHPGSGSPVLAEIADPVTGLQRGQMWVAENVGGVLRLYAPTTIGSGTNVNVLLADACADDSGCNQAVRTVEVRHLPENCRATKLISDCMRQSAVQPYGLGIGMSFRSPERSVEWGSDLLSLTLVRDRDNIVATEVIAPELGLPLRVVRRVGQFGDVPIIRDNRGFEAFVRTGETLRRFRDIGSSFEVMYSPDKTRRYFSNSLHDPLRDGGAYRIVDSMFPGKVWRSSNCRGQELSQKLQCDLIIDDVMAGDLRCDATALLEFCSINVGGRRPVQITVPRRYLAYDAWFGPESLDLSAPCCNYVSNAFAVRIK